MTQTKSEYATKRRERERTRRREDPAAARAQYDRQNAWAKDKRDKNKKRKLLNYSHSCGPGVIKKIEEILKAIYQDEVAKEISTGIRTVFLKKNMKALYNATINEYRSTKWIIRKAGLEERKVRASLVKLERDGLIESVIRSGRKYWKKTQRLTLQLKAMR